MRNEIKSEKVSSINQPPGFSIQITNSVVPHTVIQSLKLVILTLSPNLRSPSIPQLLIPNHSCLHLLISPPTKSHTHMVPHPSTLARGYPFVFYTKVALQGRSEALVSRCNPYSPTRYMHAVNLILP